MTTLTCITDTALSLSTDDSLDCFIENLHALCGRASREQATRGRSSPSDSGVSLRSPSAMSGCPSEPVQSQTQEEAPEITQDASGDTGQMITLQRYPDNGSVSAESRGTCSLVDQQDNGCIKTITQADFASKGKVMNHKPPASDNHLLTDGLTDGTTQLNDTSFLNKSKRETDSSEAGGTKSDTCKKQSRRTDDDHSSACGSSLDRSIPVNSTFVISRLGDDCIRSARSPAVSDPAQIQDSVYETVRAPLIVPQAAVTKGNYVKVFVD